MGLTPIQEKVLRKLKGYMKENSVYLGGAALALKYDHRKSYDLDFFSWKVSSEEFLNDAFRLLSGFNRMVLEPVMIVDDGRDSVKLELHERGPDVKLLGVEIYRGVPLLSEMDILAEKVYFYERCFERDVYDVRFLISKGFDPVKAVAEKFGRFPDPRRIKNACPEMWRAVEPFLGRF
jgi:hypothetical protein